MQTWTNSQPMPPDVVALAGAVAGDAMADAVEAAELLDVDVDQLAGVLALVAADRLGRLERLMRLRPRRLRTRLTVAGETPTSGGDLLAGPALAAQGLDLLDDGAGVGRCRRCGREVRSARPARPSACEARPPICAPSAGRRLRLVRRPSASARLDICRTIRSRPSGVRRAFLWMFIRSSEESLKLRNSSFLAQDRMDNLLKAHI